jgi:hypothetical protein
MLFYQYKATGIREKLISLGKIKGKLVSSNLKDPDGRNRFVQTLRILIYWVLNPGWIGGPLEMGPGWILSWKKK